jgi:zinc transport system ATP-binding protein
VSHNHSINPEHVNSILVELKSVSAGYGDELALKDVNFTVYNHDFIGVIGPNGGGKTTLVKIILGLIKPLAGSVVLANEGEQANGFVGYLPQISQIDRRFPITVRDVVLSGFMSKQSHFYRHNRHEKELALELLAQMGIAHLENRTVGELSGGQLQRVFVSRAIISSPRLLILDEPNTYVDNKFESDLYELLRKLNESMAIIIVSHDVGTISAYVKTIACVNTYLHYHESNIITEEQLESYNCPIQIITHGDVPHTVLEKHHH